MYYIAPLCFYVATYDNQQKTKFFVGLLEGVDESLETGKMAEELVDPQYPHHSHQSDDLPSLPYDLIVLQLLQNQGQIERDQCDEVD